MVWSATVLGLVLGAMLERNCRRSPVLGNGDLMIFLQDPIVLALLTFRSILMAGSVGRYGYDRYRKPAGRLADATAKEV